MAGTRAKTYVLVGDGAKSTTSFFKALDADPGFVETADKAFIWMAS